MYIGAWTEYRLAQAQLQERLQSNSAAEQRADNGGCSTRKGAGIYHPSLSRKVGIDVAGLPDRESFRRTLETALSSNLAADDAEHIAQALEPLMQRLPTIHATHGQRGHTSPEEGAIGNGTVLRYCHQRRGSQSRKTTNRRRGGSRFIHTRSEAGTESARLSSISDGTRSTRSGFSAASEPIPTAQAGGPGRSIRLGSDGVLIAEYRRGRLRGDPVNKVPQLPLVVNTQRDRFDGSSASSSYQKKTAGIPDGDQGIAGCKRGGSRRACRETERNQLLLCARSVENGGGVCGGVSTATAVTKGCKSEEGVAGGGYDSGKATTLLKVARRRDPEGLKADFQQFWAWSKKGTPSERNAKQYKEARAATATATAAAAAARTDVYALESKRETTRNNFANFGRRGAAGGAQCAASSRLAMLAKMKDIYMAKGTNSSSKTSDSTTQENVFPRCQGAFGGGATSTGAVEAPATTLTRSNHQTTTEPLVEISMPDHAWGISTRDCDSTRPPKELSGDPQTYLLADCGKVGREEKKETSGTRTMSDSTAAHPTADMVQPAVVVPDLELTESRIRLVEKYFGGSGRAGLQEQHPPAAEEENSGARQAPSGVGGWRCNQSAAGENTTEGDGGDTSSVVCGDGSIYGACSGGTRSSGRSNWVTPHQSREGGVPSKNGCDVEDMPCQASGGQNRSVGATRHSMKGREYSKGTPLDTRRVGVFEDRLQLETKEECSSEDEIITVSPAAPCVSSSKVAPAWCGDKPSLEDLVSWTRGLDFEIDVEGF